MKDPEVLELAVAEQGRLVTFDRDYGELSFARKNSAPPAAILVWKASRRPEEPAEWILRILQNREEYQDKFVVSDGETSRSRPLLHGTE